MTEQPPKDEISKHETPKDAPPSDGAESRNWVVRNRWKLGLAAAGVLGSWWWQRSRKKRIIVDRVSHDWLMQHEFETGKDQEEI